MQRQEDLLPIHYFHLVFTLPAGLNDLFYTNLKLCYSLLFKAVSKTILTVSGNTEKTDKKKVYLGAQVGITSILHSWGSNTMFHPHIHCLVTGGGLSK